MAYFFIALIVEKPKGSRSSMALTPHFPQAAFLAGASRRDSRAVTMVSMKLLCLMVFLNETLIQAALPWDWRPSLAPCPRAKHQEAFAMDGGSRERAPGMVYRLESWCADTRRQLHTARRSGRKSDINKATAAPGMACQEEA